MIGFICGAFDLFHAGHNLLLKECKLRCNYLIVGLQTDPTIDRPNKNRPVQTIYERYVQLENCKWVDKIIPYESEIDLLNLISTVPMNIRFLGEDYINSKITGYELCKELNIDIVFLNRKHNFSTSELRKRIENARSIF